MQAGVALALGIPGEAVMGLGGPDFVGGTGALAFLLLAEVVAATAVVSEAALIYMARIKNLWVSLFTITLQAALTVAIMLTIEHYNKPELWYSAGAAIALMLSLGTASIIKSRAAREHPPAADQQLALGAGLGGRAGDRRRLDRGPTARMGRAGARRPGDPRRLWLDDLAARIRARGPDTVPQERRSAGRKRPDPGRVHRSAQHHSVAVHPPGGNFQRSLQLPERTVPMQITKRTAPRHIAAALPQPRSA